MWTGSVHPVISATTFRTRYKMFSHRTGAPCSHRFRKLPAPPPNAASLVSSVTEEKVKLKQSHCNHYSAFKGLGMRFPRCYADGFLVARNFSLGLLLPLG